jgi:CRP/FNR family cyclic AMP-dependent transcriptional regulator
MRTGELGKIYQDGENIVCQGEIGDCMYVIQEGQVEIISENNGEEVRLAIRGAGEIFGEMAVFERTVRSATVRTLGQARILTIDKKNFMRRIQEDPTLAFHIVEIMSRRIRDLSEKVSQLKGQVQPVDY